MNNSKHIGIVIMAAGASVRMQAIKQTLPWKNNTLLENAMAIALNSKADSVSIVLGAHAAEIRMACNLQQGNVEIIENLHWPEGLGKSIAVGVEHAIAKFKPSALIIMLADQPYVKSDFLNNLINRYQQENLHIVATKYGRGWGVPALFDQKIFHKLMRLNGDQGAKVLFQESQGNKMAYLDAEKQIIDIDTLEEYEKYSAQND